jgi:hypothetical protein
LLHVLEGNDGIIGVVSHHIVQQKSQSQESILGAPFCKMVAAGMHNAERLLRMIGTGQVWTLLVVIQCRPKWNCVRPSVLVMYSITECSGRVRDFANVNGVKRAKCDRRVPIQKAKTRAVVVNPIAIHDIHQTLHGGGRFRATA